MEKAIDYKLVIPLREYVDIRIIEFERFVDSKFHGIEVSTEKALHSMNERLVGMNEIRSALKDQAMLFLTKDEHMAYMKGVDADIRILRESKALLEGKASQASVYVSYVFAAISILLSLLGIFLHLTSK